MARLLYLRREQKEDNLEHPVQITCRGLDSSEALEQAVRARAQKLETYYDKIQSCRVVLEAPVRRHQQGNPYHVRIRLTVPGEEIVVSREPADHDQQTDLYALINDAFGDAGRRLEQYVERRRRV